MISEHAKRLAEALRNAEHVAVLTGAGISAESGLPTFRDPLTGYWAKFRPEELATPEAFRRNPILVWRWYAERRRLALQAKPNPGHAALVRLESKVSEFMLVTQNVDGLHRIAGSRKVIELHGNIHDTRCFDNDHPMTPIDTPAHDDTPPTCPLCGSYARPGVVWFGESLPEGAFEAGMQAAMDCDVFLVIGTSGIVQPAALLAGVARQAGAVVAVVNPDPQAAVSGALFLQGPSGDLLPRILEEAWPEEGRSNP